MTTYQLAVRVKEGGDPNGLRFWVFEAEHPPEALRIAISIADKLALTMADPHFMVIEARPVVTIEKGVTLQ